MKGIGRVNPLRKVDKKNANRITNHILLHSLLASYILCSPVPFTTVHPVGNRRGNEEDDRRCKVNG